MRLFCNRTVGMLILCTLILLSCVKKKSDENPATDPEGFNRELMLANYVDQLIIPGYANFKVKLDSMNRRSGDFTSNPTLGSLSDFRDAWKEAYIEWQKVELFDVGPAADLSFRSFMNVYPTNVTAINANILNASANLEIPASYDAQGFPAFDYLLNGIAATDQEILDLYTTADHAEDRIAYVTRLMTQMNNKLTYVNSNWTESYRNEFVSKSSTGMNASTSIMVNAYVLNFERYIRTGKFGLPSGAMAGGVPTPTLVEAPYKKDISLTLAKTAHQASIDFFNGKSVLTGAEGPSLKTYLDAVDAKDSNTGIKLTTAINDQFAVCAASMNLLAENLSSEVTNNTQKMVDVFNELQAQVRLLKVDLTSALSITITYTDNDGD